MSTHRFLLVDHPDGRQTIAVCTTAEIGQLFPAEAVARLALGRAVTHDGKPHTDMQAFLNAHRDDALPLGVIISRLLRRMARTPEEAVV